MNSTVILPHINAVLNSCSFILLIVGYLFIRSGKMEQHRITMIAAIVVSGVFLISYLIYHFTAPVFVFPGKGWTVPAYYTLLISHVVLATLVTPMVVVIAWLALKGNFSKHKAIARWVWPTWLFVSSSGVAVYIILYHVYSIQY